MIEKERRREREREKEIDREEEVLKTVVNMTLMERDKRKKDKKR